MFNPERTKVLVRFLSFALCLTFLGACATAPPYQEMSDARQAIKLAEEAGAASKQPALFGEAQEFMASAKRRIDKRQFGTARYDAIRAREKAIRALDLLTRVPEQ